MHPFIMKVTIAAVVLTLASVASASQARADTALSLDGSWYNSYDKPAYKQTSKVPTAKIIIRKSDAKHIKRHTYKKHPKPTLRKYRSHRHHYQEPRRRNVHASGYSW